MVAEQSRSAKIPTSKDLLWERWRQAGRDLAKSLEGEIPRDLELEEKLKQLDREAEREERGGTLKRKRHG